MAKISGSARLYTTLGVGFVIVMAWKGGQAITMRLQGLEVKQAPHVDMAGHNLNAKSFPLVLVKQPSAQEPEAVPQAPLDELFARHGDEAKKTVEPNYVDLFKQSAQITGYSSEIGVFLNGNFYRAGDKIEALAMDTSGGARIVPTVEIVTDEQVVFRVGRERVVFVAKK